MGHRIEWQWRDSGSGPGHMQRVITYDEDPVSKARKLLRAHLEVCGTCAPDSWCEASDRLYAAYQRARKLAS